jgi:hypothetical protein
MFERISTKNLGLKNLPVTIAGMRVPKISLMRILADEITAVPAIALHITAVQRK